MSCKKLYFQIRDFSDFKHQKIVENVYTLYISTKFRVLHWFKLIYCKSLVIDSHIHRQ